MPRKGPKRIFGGDIPGPPKYRISIPWNPGMDVRRYGLLLHEFLAKRKVRGGTVWGVREGRFAVDLWDPKGLDLLRTYFHDDGITFTEEQLEPPPNPSTLPAPTHEIPPTAAPQTPHAAPEQPDEIRAHVTGATRRRGKLEPTYYQTFRWPDESSPDNLYIRLDKELTDRGINVNLCMVGGDIPGTYILYVEDPNAAQVLRAYLDDHGIKVIDTGRSEAPA